LEVSEAQRLKQLEEETPHVERIVADNVAHPQTALEFGGESASCRKPGSGLSIGGYGVA
jgi:hypothetical protein